MPSESAYCARGRDVPKKDLLVSAHGGEASVVARDGEVEDGVTVRRVALDQTGFGDLGVRFEGIVEVNGAVGGAAEDLGDGDFRLARLWRVWRLMCTNILPGLGGKRYTMHRA